VLSRASKYAILSTLFLAEHTSEDRKISAREISDSIDVPTPFLAKLFQQLVRAGIISSTKGPRGGFFMTAKNKDHTICDIIDNIDGMQRLTDCFLGLNACDSMNPCPVHFIVEPFKENLLKKFRDKSILEFAEEISEQGRVLSLKEIGLP
jgi:Rrf2 family protein